MFVCKHRTGTRLVTLPMPQLSIAFAQVRREFGFELLQLLDLRADILQFPADQVAHRRARFHFARAQIQQLLDLAKRKTESLHGADELKAEQIIFCVEPESSVGALR